MLTTRTVVMAMAVALAVGGGFIAATAATGSASPAEWTLQVKAVVTQCRTTMAPGERGIGHCVSDNVEANPSPTPTAVPTQVAQPPVHPAVAADPRAEPALVRPATSTSRPAESDIEVDDHGGHSRPGTPSPPPDD